MVKNTTGGNKSKGMARKLTNNNNSGKLRVSMDENEQYACISRLLGNGMCRATTSHGKDLLCFIRGKFRGRNKRANVISLSSIVLVGIRSWAGDNPKECDLLEVYDQNETNQLRMIPNINWALFNEFYNNSKNVPDDDNIIFNNDGEYESLHNNIYSSTTTTLNNNNNNNDNNNNNNNNNNNDIVEFDDI